MPHINSKTVILIDGGYVDKQFSSIQQRTSMGLIKHLIHQIKEKIKLEEVFRIFYYDCPPFGEKVTIPAYEGNPESSINYKDSPTYIAKEKFLKDLETIDTMALRLGNIRFFGEFKYKDGKLSPDIKQKSVDMKIGLDIAWMAGKKIVDNIILVTNDTDFTSPMKLARREGILVYICSLLTEPAKDLVIHSDYRINLTEEDLRVEVGDNFYLVSKQDPLSIEYIENFIYDGNNMFCVQQAIEYEKAKFFKDSNKQTSVLKLTNINELINYSRSEGNKITNFNPTEWETQFQIILKKIYLAKKEQIETVLLSTQSKHIVYVHKFYLYAGIEPNTTITTEDDIEHKNYIGKILMELRKEWKA
jgi:uncharacterized LabA/DUF88 family protein/predicted NAD-dependent protein-ADP-ribosyltransferase YbiA (DUF1768 family)